MSNLAGLLEDSATRYPDRVAIVFPSQAGDTRLTYAQVEGAANQVANLLVSRGIRPGDKVALSCPNLPYFPVVYYGILKAGAVVVPLNVLLKGREIAYHLADSGAKAYFCFEGTADLPLGQEGWTGFNDSESCEHFYVLTAVPTTDSPIEGRWTALTIAIVRLDVSLSERNGSISGSGTFCISDRCPTGTLSIRGTFSDPAVAFVMTYDPGSQPESFSGTLQGSSQLVGTVTYTTTSGETRSYPLTFFREGQ